LRSPLGKSYQINEALPTIPQFSLFRSQLGTETLATHEQLQCLKKFDRKPVPVRLVTGRQRAPHSVPGCVTKMHAPVDDPSELLNLLI
jgi:hypothetical protein